MSKSKKFSSTRSKVNSHGYNVSNFNVLDMSVRRESKTGRLISANRKPLKKIYK